MDLIQGVGAVPVDDEYIFSPQTGPGKYEVSYPSYEGVICAQQSLRYIQQVGVSNILNHVLTLTNRLAAEMPRLGYPTITPDGNKSPIIAFEAKDPRATMEKLRNANIHVAMRFGNKMRVSPAVFNNKEALQTTDYAKPFIDKDIDMDISRISVR